MKHTAISLIAYSKEFEYLQGKKYEKSKNPRENARKGKELKK